MLPVLPVLRGMAATTKTMLHAAVAGGFATRQSLEYRSTSSNWRRPQLTSVDQSPESKFGSRVKIETTP